MNKTSIEWTDFSSNPIYATSGGKRGWFCEKVTPGCAHCYAETLNEGRFGNGLAFIPANRSKVEFHFNTAELREWQKPRYAGARVFVCDMTDLFGEWVPEHWLHATFEAMWNAPEVTFQVLTKRPERMRSWLTATLPSWRPYLDNVWRGVSVENQRWTTRIDDLRRVPAAVRFLSCEPLLGPLRLDLHDISWAIVGGESGPRRREMNLS